MDWVKIEVGISRHPKLHGLSDKSFRKYLELWCYAGEFETDGFVPESVAKNAQSLVERGLLITAPGGYQLEGFLNHNPTKRRLQEQRNAVRNRVTKHRGNAVTLENVLTREVEVEVEENPTNQQSKPRGHTFGWFGGRLR